jgi:hypothetical protein
MDWRRQGSESGEERAESREYMRAFESREQRTERKQCDEKAVIERQSTERLSTERLSRCSW